jgi:ABC-type Na+ efflux pump permease subunit
MRFGLGPVFIYECLISARRWQMYALRAGGVLALLAAMALTAGSSDVIGARGSWRDYANMGAAYFVALIGVELAVVMLAAPAATAGAICVDRARGTLAHMLMTDLSDSEIVLGKLAARLLPVLGLVACTWPVMAISSLLGGIDPIALTLAFAIILAVAILGCTMAMAVSVWARKAHEVILATYTVFILALLLWPIWYLLTIPGFAAPPPDWTLLANPFYLAFAPYADPGKLELADYLIFFGAMLGASALFCALAVWRTRAVACRDKVQKNQGGRIGPWGRITRFLPAPSLDRNPVLWREWHRARPSVWMSLILTLLMGTTGVLCLAGAIAFWKYGADYRPGAYWQIAGVCSYVLHVIFGLMILSAVAPTSMAEERQRGSLDVLAVTALSTRDIVIGKWLGTFRLALFMAIGPGLLAFAMATALSEAGLNIIANMPPDQYWVLPRVACICGACAVVATILGHGALMTSIGLALAVWCKRQSRAIALSVASFIAIVAAWPIVVAIIFSQFDDLGEDLAALSPVVICSRFVSFFSMRIYAYTGGTLWWGWFWAAEVLLIAIGLLALTVRTFDHCFDRIPAQPPRFSVGSLLIMTLAAMIAAGSLVAGIVAWTEGVAPGVGLPWRSSLGTVAYSLLIAIGLLLAAVEAARSARRKWAIAPAADPSRSVPSFVVERSWESFRLVLFLAIGPAVFALALATAHEPPRYEPVYTTNAKAGTQVVSAYKLVKNPPPHAGALPLGPRLLLAAVFVGTILVHGGAAISAGVAFAAVKWSSRRARTAVVGLALLVLLLMPLYLYVFAQTGTLGSAGWSFVMASDAVLNLLKTRTSLNFGETLWPVVGWDVAVALSCAAICWWASWAWRLGPDGIAEKKPLSADSLDAGLAAPETTLTAD